MKNKQWLRTLLCICLALGMVWSLCACGSTGETPGGETPGGETPGGETPGGETPGGETPGGETPGGETPGSETPGGETPGGETPGGEDTPAPPTPITYADGAAVQGGGATIAEGAFALTATTYDPASAEETKAGSFFRSAVKLPGKVFRVSDDKPVSLGGAANQTYDGGGAILIAPKGLEIKGGSGITLRNLIVIGSVTVNGVTGLTLEQVEIVSEGTALAVDAASSELKMNDCRLTGKTAIELAAPESAILNSYFAFTEKGIVDTAAQGSTVQSCMFEGSGTAIASSASESAYRSNTMKLDASSTGILLEGDVLNSLVALNDITGAQRSIALFGVNNVSVVLNRGVSVEAEGNRHLYIVDNSLGGRLTANNNNYFIADGNTYPDDEYDHATVQAGNQNHNGNNLMDVDARPEVGADESLLPHPDKDLFVGMARKEYVKDVLNAEPSSIDAYIAAHSQTDDYVIIAPGAYMNKKALSFRAAHSNTTVYAYGVYMERQVDLGQMMNYQDAENIVIKGMTLGFKQQSCGQVYVLEKLENNTLRVVTGAGMMNDFGNTNTKYFNTTGMGAQRMGTFYAYCDTYFEKITKDDTTAVPTMLMEVLPSVYEMLAKGDVLTCRASNGGRTVAVGVGSRGIAFYDFNLYGNAGGFAFIEEKTKGGTVFYRVCDTTQNGFVVDETTYNAYLALEEQYGVDLEIEIDELGRFRGSPCHIGSIDATHTVSCAQGSQATFCLFENMCDDATNQGHFHGRIHEVVDNRDGTTTLIYKGTFSTYSYDNHYYAASDYCADFAVGDRVFVYSPTGQLICDTEALTKTLGAGTLTIDWAAEGIIDDTSTTTLKKVTVKTEAINFAALEGFNLADNRHENTHKVRIDNMSQASNGFTFDNCKFQNIRSRGLLVKASDGAIKNCTFRNIGMACAAILFEVRYSESGITENMVIDRNLFDHTGYFKNQDLYATVSIYGLGSSVAEDYLLYKNIAITNNKIINRTTDYAIYINSAKDITVENNYFGEFVGNNFTDHTEAPESKENPKPVIHINGAMNVKIAGNRFPETGTVQTQIVAERNKNIYGADVEKNGEPLIPDNED